MPFCPQCGASNPEGARFCQACGKPVPASAAAPAAPTAGPAGSPPPPAPGYRPPPRAYGAPPGASGVTTRHRNPKTAAAWGILWGFGAQAFYNGQPLKGVAQIVVNFLFVWKMVQATGATSGAGAAWFLGLAIAAIFMYDGYRVAQKHNAGVPVGPWTFF
jgi:TM2 domain-containing membrane protein YozV